MISEIALLRRAAVIAVRSSCWIGIGCVVAKDGKILAKGWNETLPGEYYCQEFRKARKGLTFSNVKVRPLPTNAGCIRHELNLSQGRNIEKVCSIHAETNAIASAARRGIKLAGAAMYVTSFPCLICMRSIVAAGIKRVVYMNDFYKPHDMELFVKNGIKVEQITENYVWSQDEENNI